ncbi:BTAD domain-containing putative transcriptional regulator [Nonomuraea sp. NPDC050202]|uniref:BTAD domain-containing putative transcriptional regulator n=1 Tax=Nonomuraea sp. NPDC050202 TaxID=3155035 RepID=UPI0033F72DE6
MSPVPRPPDRGPREHTPAGPRRDRLRLGRHRAALTELPLLISEHPLRGRPVHLLMMALHRDGRRAEAPAAYRDPAPPALSLTLSGILKTSGMSRRATDQ